MITLLGSVTRTVSVNKLTLLRSLYSPEGSFHQINAAGGSIATKIRCGGFMAGFRSFSDKVTAYQLKTDPLPIAQDTAIPGAIGAIKVMLPQAPVKNGHSVLGILKR